jgi:hypothetical protein
MVQKSPLGTQAKASATAARRARPIVVMLSSRANTTFDGDALSVHRERLRVALESEKLLGVQLFQVWTNESAPAAPAGIDWWDHCTQQARDADVVIVIYNGESGSPRTIAGVTGGIGICHAEFLAGVETGSARVRVIELAQPVVTTAADRLFQDDLGRYDVFTAHNIGSAQALNDAVMKALLDAVRSLVTEGRRGLGRGTRYAGSALTWTRLDMRSRRAAMREELVAELGGSSNGRDEAQAVPIQVSRGGVLAICDAIPGPLSLAPARELVGQSFLRDHEYAGQLTGGVAGPVHFIACQRGVTEAQAIRQLGHPDAVVVNPPFGVYVADDVQKIQMVFLADCHDRGNTRTRVQQALAWLERANESPLLLRRAQERAEIVRTVARFRPPQGATQTAGPATTAGSVPAPRTLPGGQAASVRSVSPGRPHPRRRFRAK